MAKLSSYLAQQRDLEFDFAREVRAVCDLLKGVRQIGAGEHILSLTPGDGYVAEGNARAILTHELQTSLHDVLIRYLHSLCLEGSRLGLAPALFQQALRQDPAHEGPQTEPAAPATATIIPLAPVNPGPTPQTPSAGWQPRQLQDTLLAAQPAA